MRVLFVHQGLNTFVQRDLDILRSRHDVRVVCFQNVNDVPSIWQGTVWADLTFCWFGKLHAFFAILFSKLLGKRTVVVAGGDDVACEPDINYGMFAYWWKKWCPLFVFREADLILSVSEHNRRQTIGNAGANPDKVKVLYHGFDHQKWQRMGHIHREDIVLTVSRVTAETLLVKGLELYVRSAQHVPHVPFVLVGPWQDDAIGRLREMASPNARFTGGLYGDDLVRIYSRAKVYVQVSAHESFGCSLAEAMLCECVPVVSRRAALPEVVGAVGFYVDALSPETVAAQVVRALASGTGGKAREQIVREFPLEKRRQALLAAMDEVMSS